MRVIYVNHSRHNDTPCIGYRTVDIAQGVFSFSFSFVLLPVLVEVVVDVFFVWRGWGLGATVVAVTTVGMRGSGGSRGSRGSEALWLWGYEWL